MKSEIIIIDSKAFESLIAQISTIIETAVFKSVKEHLGDTQSDWVKSSIAMKILNITSKTTLKKLRVRYDFKYTSSGSGNLYSRSCLLAHLESKSSH